MSRPLAPGWVALLGGLYSFTATTVVLARRARAELATLLQGQTGIIFATTVMYLRLLVIILVFSHPLAFGLALLGFSALGFVMAGPWRWRNGGHAAPTQDAQQPGNPLELGAPVIFAALFVLISLVTAWARSQLETAGLYLLAAVVGVSDIDPFVLSLAEHGSGQISVASDVIAILIATLSNNLLKAGYTAAFAGARQPAASRCTRDQEGVDATIASPIRRRPKPVQHLDAWLEQAAVTDGTLFRRLSQCGRQMLPDRIPDQSVAETVKACGGAAGLDPAGFAGHSLRAGFLTSAAHAGHRFGRCRSRAGTKA